MVTVVESSNQQCWTSCNLNSVDTGIVIGSGKGFHFHQFLSHFASMSVWLSPDTMLYLDFNAHVSLVDPDCIRKRVMHYGFKPLIHMSLWLSPDCIRKRVIHYGFKPLIHMSLWLSPDCIRKRVMHYGFKPLIHMSLWLIPDCIPDRKRVIHYGFKPLIHMSLWLIPDCIRKRVIHYGFKPLIHMSLWLSPDCIRKRVIHYGSNLAFDTHVSLVQPGLYHEESDTLWL